MSCLDCIERNNIQIPAGVVIERSVDIGAVPPGLGARECVIAEMISLGLVSIREKYCFLGGSNVTATMLEPTGEQPTGNESMQGHPPAIVITRWD